MIWVAAYYQFMSVSKSCFCLSPRIYRNPILSEQLSVTILAALNTISKCLLRIFYFTPSEFVASPIKWVSVIASAGIIVSKCHIQSSANLIWNASNCVHIIFLYSFLLLYGEFFNFSPRWDCIRFTYLGDVIIRVIVCLFTLEYSIAVWPLCIVKYMTVSWGLMKVFHIG